MVVDNDCRPKAKAVEQWLASHPRWVLLWVPTYGPRAHPIKRAFGDGHATCTRNHQRKRLRALGQDVEQPGQENGPWQYTLSRLYEAPEVTAVVESLAAEQQPKVAA